MTERASAEHGETDWRRLASDRNVSHSVARALWEQAREASPDDAVQAAHVYHAMLDEAAKGDVSPEPGRETLAASHGVRDPSTLGPGKWTRVLVEQPGSQAPASGAKPSASRLRDELLAAGQATQRATSMLAGADPATIVEALRELTARQGADVVKKVLAVAGGAIERALNARGPGAAPAATSAPAATTSTPASPASPPASAAQAAARAATSPRGISSASPASTPRGPSPGSDRKR
jgi:hypothetical protein